MNLTIPIFFSTAVYKLNTCNFELDNADNVDEESESEVDDDGRQYSSDDEVCNDHYFGFKIYICLDVSIANTFDFLD